MNNPLAGYSKKIILLLFPLALLEFIFFPSTNNIYGICTFGLAWFISTKIVFEQIDIRDHFIPQIILFIFLCSFFFLPLVITLTEFKPLTFNMFVPWDVFTHQLLLVITISIALRVSANLNMGKALSRFLQEKTLFFTPPTEKQVWLIGLTASFISYIALITDYGWVSKLMVGFRFLILTPYILIAPQLYGNKKPTKLLFKLTLWTLIIASFGIATNSRGTMFMGLVSIVMVSFMNIVFYNMPNIRRKLLVGILLAIFLSGVTSRFAISMLAVRSNRADISPTELFQQTIAIYNNEEKYTQIKKIISQKDVYSLFAYWDETYSDNIILERIGNLKVCDNSIFYSQKVGYNNSEIRRFLIEKLQSLLPSPILQVFKINLEKENTQFSLGDKIYAVYTKNESYLGGYRVSSFHAALAAFGYSLYPITFASFVILFSILNCAVIKEQKRYLLSPLALLLSYEWFNLLNNNGGLQTILAFVIRGCLQYLVLYSMLFFIARLGIPTTKEK